jgi:hypothetical protein
MVTTRDQQYEGREETEEPGPTKDAKQPQSEFFGFRAVYVFACMSSKDCLVMCGRGFCCWMKCASATLESPLRWKQSHHRSIPVP